MNHFSWRNLGRILAQYTIVLCITVGLGEVCLRAYNYFNPTFIFYTDSYNRYRGQPHSKSYNFRLNSGGFKDKEFTPKTEGTYRIVGLGDSFAYGVVPYEDNYLTVLEADLKSLGVNAEVLNMGIPSIDPSDYLALFMREGVALQPDMVLVSFFMGNDLFIQEQRGVITYSYVATLLHYAFTVRKKFKTGVVRGERKYCDDCPTFDEASYLEVEKNRSSIYLSTNKQSTGELVNESLGYIQQMQDYCSKHGIKLVVAVIPDDLQINQELQSSIRSTFYPDTPMQVWIYDLPNRLLRKRLEELHIDYIDLLPYFLQKTKEQRLYVPRDTHWNIAGNRFAANIIGDHILDDIRKDLGRD